MNRIFAAAAISVLAGLARAEAIVDVTKLAGKTEKQVAAYLGAPASCGNSKHGKKCQYDKGQTEVIFIGGTADWITVAAIDQVPFSKAALGALGLEETSPSFANAFVMRWESIEGLREVSLFRGASGCDYAYIKVKTQ